jgi:hypothetical protein
MCEWHNESFQCSFETFSDISNNFQLILLHLRPDVSGIRVLV